jgi:hypothetical protein
MVPSTLWLLRRKPRVLLIGGISWITGIAIVFAAMRWFSRQPYAIPETLVPDGIDFKWVENVVAIALRGGAELALLLIPVLLMFVAPLRKADRRMVLVFVAGSLFFASMGLILFFYHGLDHWLAPFLGNYVSARGVVDVQSIMGERPVVLHYGLRVVLTVATVLGLVGLVTVFFGNAPKLSSIPNKPALSWGDLGAILAPFSVAYAALVAPRAATGGFYDRYLLPLLMLSLLVLARYWQERVRPDLPIASLVLIGIFGFFAIAATHDLFAMYRGYQVAIDELRSSGLPATAIRGSWENDGWTELEAVGYINERRIRIPRDAYVLQPITGFPAGCDGNSTDRVPAIKPIYALSFDPEQCGGQAGFPPVPYRTWLAPHIARIYIVRFPDLSRR